VRIAGHVAKTDYREHRIVSISKLGMLFVVMPFGGMKLVVFRMRYLREAER
jgi:hypothetical protein